MNFEFPSVIDSSIRSSFVACPQQCFYNYFMHLAPLTPSIHLHFGACFAEGCRATRQAIFLQEASLDDALISGIRAIYEEWGDYDEDSSLVKTLPKCIEALAWYFDEHHPRHDSVQPFMTDTGPAVEFSFGIPLPINHPDTGDPILYAGRFDMLGIYKGVVYPVDEKTCSQLGATWARQWNLRSQFTGYCWAAQQYGYPAAGAIVRGVCLLKKSITFGEAITMRPQWQIDRWYAQLLQDIQRMVHEYEDFRDQKVPFSLSLDGACTHYAGCQFERLCTIPRPEPWIETEYTVRKWNPLARNPREEEKLQ